MNNRQCISERVGLALNVCHQSAAYTVVKQEVVE